MYSGANRLGVNRDRIEDYHVTNTAIALFDGLLDNGHCFCIYKWHTSMEICDILKKRSTDFAGVLRRNRKFSLPADVTKKKLRTEEEKVMYEHHLGLAVTHYKHKNRCRYALYMYWRWRNSSKKTWGRDMYTKCCSHLHKNNDGCRPQ